MKKTVCVLISISLLFSLTSCWDNGTYEELNAMREEFSKYGGRCDVAFTRHECISFNGRRFKIKQSEDIDDVYLYNGYIYYSTSEVRIIELSIYERLKIYKCDFWGENSELLYDTDFIRCKDMDSYFVSNPTPALYWCQPGDRYGMLYDLDAGTITNVDSTVCKDFRLEKSDKYDVWIDREKNILYVSDMVTKETKSRFINQMMLEYQASIDKFGFYLYAVPVYLSCDKFFIVYGTDTYVDGHFPKLLFELKIDTMELDFVGYFETYALESNNVVANYALVGN